MTASALASNLENLGYTQESNPVLETTTFGGTICSSCLSKYAKYQPNDSFDVGCSEGEIKRGSDFEFICRGGRLVTTGRCFMEDGSRVESGGTSRQKYFVYLCTIDAKKDPEVLATGCTDDTGEFIQANGIFKYDGKQFRCISRGDNHFVYQGID
uniref:Abnormal cell migration protein 18-like fibronectin type I domain-containing protein n=1 Tax=Romanomermis culicivorax TaxID=13658 RepID=A0A915JNU1_ROMCU